MPIEVVIGTGVIVHPGDTLVVIVSRYTPLVADELIARCAVELPDVRIVVLDANQVIVYRPDKAVAG
jgi:hypothetical protein